MNNTKAYRLLLGAAALGAALVSVNPAAAGPSASSGGSAQSGYNAIPSKVSGNVPSEGFEANADTDFGDEVALGGPQRGLQSMSVLFSSWGCQSGHWYSKDCVTAPGATFDVPVTYTVYADNSGARGATLSRTTATVQIAYRPSASPECTGDDAGKWYNSKDRTCYNGFPQVVQLSMPSVTLPDRVIWTVSFNTSHYGSPAVGESAPCYTSSGGCGYDSLNVGAFSFPNAPFSGTDLDEDKVFRNGAMESGWTGFRPLGTIVTK